MDQASVISATYLQTVIVQRRGRTSERLLSVRCNFVAHCRSDRRYSDVHFTQKYCHDEAWSDVLHAGRMVQAGMNLGRFPSAFIRHKSWVLHICVHNIYKRYSRGNLERCDNFVRHVLTLYVDLRTDNKRELSNELMKTRHGHYNIHDPRFLPLR